MRKILFAALLAMPAGGAAAHSQMERSSPANGETIAPPINEIVLEFGQKVEPNFASLRLERDGRRIAIAPQASVGGGKKVLTFKGLNLGVGRYRAVWGALSGDGHRVDGVFSFTVE